MYEKVNKVFWVLFVLARTSKNISQTCVMQWRVTAEENIKAKNRKTTTSERQKSWNQR